MRICVEEGIVLDTDANLVENSSDFKEDKRGQAILYNISENGSVFYCDLCFKGKQKLNQDYATIKRYLDNNSIPYFEVKSSSPAKSKKPVSLSVLFLKNVMKNAIIAQGNGEAHYGDNDIENYSSTAADKMANMAANIRNYSSDRTYDIDYMLSEDEPDEAAACRAMILDAKKIIKNNYPFYYSILKMQNEIYRHAIYPNDTMGICPGSLVLYVEYVLSLSLPQLVFDLCHEVSHLIFMHTTRIKLRNSEIWNIAGDLIVNKALCEDFGINPKRGNDIVEFNNGIYLSDLNLDEETTETVYADIMNQIEEQQKMQQMMGGQGGQSGRSKGGNNQQNQNNQNMPPQRSDPNADLRNRIRQLYDRIKELANDPINATIKPLVDKAIEKGKFEERIKALGA